TTTSVCCSKRAGAACRRSTTCRTNILPDGGMPAMRTTAAVAAVAIAFTFGRAHAISEPQARDAVAVDADDIGGTVSGPKGPEAGVWVIAETSALPTKFARIVVTDDRGRYLIPDLPKASYRVWVRGYGLVDSPRVDGTPG